MTRERYKEIDAMCRILNYVCPRWETRRRLIALYGNDALTIWREFSSQDLFGFTGWVDGVRHAQFISMRQK